MTMLALCLRMEQLQPGDYGMSEENDFNATCVECGAPMCCDSCDEDGEPTRKCHSKDSHICSRRCYLSQNADDINDERREREADERAFDRQMRSDEARSINNSHSRIY